MALQCAPAVARCTYATWRPRDPLRPGRNHRLSIAVTELTKKLLYFEPRVASLICMRIIARPTSTHIVQIVINRYTSPVIDDCAPGWASPGSLPAAPGTPPFVSETRLLQNGYSFSDRVHHARLGIGEDFDDGVVFSDQLAPCVPVLDPSKLLGSEFRLIGL